MKKSFIKNLATCFGLGDMPKAPGTFGTLGGIPIYIGMLFLRKVFPNHMLYNSFYFMFLMTFFVVAVYVSDIAEREIYHKKDPQNVVIDEVLGYLTTLFLINPVLDLCFFFLKIFFFNFTAYAGSAPRPYQRRYIQFW